MIGANRAPGSADASSKTVTGPNEVYLVGPGVLSARGATRCSIVSNTAYLKMTFNRDFDKPEHEFFYPRTDAGPFLERGILTIGFFTGIHPRYHQPSDEARHLDPKKMEAITQDGVRQCLGVCRRRGTAADRQGHSGDRAAIQVNSDNSKLSNSKAEESLILELWSLKFGIDLVQPSAAANRTAIRPGAARALNDCGSLSMSRLPDGRR